MNLPLMAMKYVFLSDIICERSHALRRALRAFFCTFLLRTHVPFFQILCYSSAIILVFSDFYNVAVSLLEVI